MANKSFRAKAWNNGSHHATGAGYGIQLDANDRNKYFDTNWNTVTLFLEETSCPISVNVDKPSFWGEVCKELIKKEIGIWLIDNGVAPWPKMHPQK